MIHGVDCWISDEDIVSACKDKGVLAAKRTTKKRPGGTVNQLSLLCLTVDMTELPLVSLWVIKDISCESLYARCYIHCTKCQMIGHTVNICKGFERCV